MRKIGILATLILALGLLSGCNNLSPRDNLSPQLKQEIDDIQGKQHTLENNQNAIKLELMRLQNASEVTGDNNQVQQGWLNVQADGILIAGFAIATISLLLFYMYKSAKYKMATDIMAGQIRAYQNDDLRERVVAAAWNTSVEKLVYKMIE